MLTAQVPVPCDLSRVKTKIFFNLTKRQLICFSLAACIGLPVFFLVKKTGNVTLASACMIILMMPFFLLALYEKDRKPLEFYLKNFIRQRFQRPAVRIYQTDNYYRILMREYQAKKEVSEIVLNAEKRKRTYTVFSGTKPEGTEKSRRNSEKGAGQ